MTGVHIVTDSSCDLSEADTTAWGVGVVPLSIRFGSEEFIDREELLNNSQILEYAHEQVQHLVNTKTGFKSFERIFKVHLLPRAFQVGVEMTQKLSIKRNVVAEIYKKEVASLFDAQDGDS